MGKSNVSVKSNVYVVNGEHPLSDPKFIQKVKDLKALVKLSEMRFRNISLQAWQLELIDRGMYCSLHDECERPFGLIAKGKDSLEFICRCSIIQKCPYATKGKCWDIYRG